MNVHIGETFERFIQELIHSGFYQSQSEVVREGLRLLKEREELRKARLQSLQSEIQRGLDSSLRGESEPFDIEAIKQDGRNRLEVGMGSKAKEG